MSFCAGSRVPRLREDEDDAFFSKNQGAGGDLLFRGLSLSTIGAENFQGRVRDGIVCSFLAIPTSSLVLLQCSSVRCSSLAEFSLLSEAF